MLKQMLGSFKRTFKSTLKGQLYQALHLLFSVIISNKYILLIIIVKNRNWLYKDLNTAVHAKLKLNVHYLYY